MSGAGKLQFLLRMLANPRREVERQLGVEDFNHPGTPYLLGLAPAKADIVHCHNLHPQYFDIRYLPRLSRQVPVILNLRDSWLLTGHCAGPGSCQRWMTGCGSCPDLNIYPSVGRDATAYNWRRKRRVFNASTLYVTTPSQWLMDQVQTSMLRGVQHRVIPNAIDLKIFQPDDRQQARKSLGLPAESKIILTSAHSSFKDLKTISSALANLNTTQVGEVTFVCLGSNGSIDGLDKRHTILPGFEQDPNRVAKYYQASDVFVHSAKAEAFGKTVTEALACGVPVVATAVGGIPEQISDGETGFLVPKADSRAMAVALKRLLSDKDLRTSIGDAGRIDAAKRFGLDRQVAAFLEWYEEIIENWERHRAYVQS